MERNLKGSLGLQNQCKKASEAGIVNKRVAATA
jgi:hypothetical protein